MTATDNSSDDAARSKVPPIKILVGVLESDKVVACEQQLGYTFQDKSLLSLALTHASGADHRLASNERLEFLGDAILGAVICQRLYQKYPESLEGDLTTIKSAVVSRQTCAKVSQDLGLEQFLVIGKGMTNSGFVPSSLLAGLFESLVAAIYLDGGEDSARSFIERYMDPEIELVASGESGGNYKSSFIDYIIKEQFDVIINCTPDIPFQSINTLNHRIPVYDDLTFF